MTMTRIEALKLLTAPGEPYELMEVDLYGHPCRAFRNAPPTLRDLFESTRSDLDFIVFEDERLTFEGTWAQAARLAHHLYHDLGLRHGDRVAISMRNYPEWIISFMAVTSIGGIVVAMNALWQPGEMDYALNDSQPRVAILDQERIDRLVQCQRLPRGLAVMAVRPAKPLPPGMTEWHEALSGIGSVAMPEVDLDPNDDATILYTSGSTGYPKGAVSCHRNIISALLSWELDYQASSVSGLVGPPDPDAPQTAALLGVPLFHVAGSHAVYLASYRSQRRLVCMYKWDVDRGAELIERERVSMFVATPAITGDLVAAAPTLNRDLSSLALVGGGGAPRAPEQVRNIDKNFANALPNTGWGMTETNAIGTGIAGADYLQRPESSGRVSAVLDIKIVDEAGNTLAPRQRGELLVRGTSVIRGYWHRPDANRTTFQDGWMRTGDVAYLDEEGFLFIVDRIKDLVIRGGENIGCGSVEAALLEHPSILEACVYGVPDDRLGEEVGATLYITGPIDEDELRAFLKERLAAFEIPRYYIFFEEPLPRTASGKIYKRELRAAASEQWGKGKG
ncbi:MAG: class I adenylate-forming enzyme family protein [Alphaproteobacteria bacterium]